MTLTLQELSVLFGMTTGAAENWISRGIVSTSLQATRRGQARSYDRDSSIEIGLLSAWSMAGLPLDGAHGQFIQQLPAWGRLVRFSEGRGPLGPFDGQSVGDRPPIVSGFIDIGEIHRRVDQALAIRKSSA